MILRKRKRSRFFLFLIIICWVGLFTSCKKNETASNGESESSETSGNTETETEDTTEEDSDIPDLINSTIYYVSPDGNDFDPGTEDQPWKSLGKAARYLEAGETAIFEDGVYYQKSIVTFTNSGEDGAPIIIRSRHEHGAKIVFQGSTKDVQKINILDKSFIEIRDFEITQEEKAITNTIDIFIRIKNSSDCSVIGNKIYYCLEEGIKISDNSKNMLVEGNEVSDTDHEGIDFVNVRNSIVRNNKVSEAGRVGLMMKGGVRNIQIYNNIIENKRKVMRNGAHGITLGGATDPISTYDSAGYEGYNLFAWNNIILSKAPGSIDNGITLAGCKDCHVYNNNIVGAAKAGISMEVSDGLNNFIGDVNWAWNPPTENPHIKNNIIMNVRGEAIGYYSPEEGSGFRPEESEIDYNLYYNNRRGVPTVEEEPHSLFSEDPLFYDPESDWRLKSGSPAIDKGTALPNTFEGFEGSSVDIDFMTFDGQPRSGDWNIGVF